MEIINNKIEYVHENGGSKNYYYVWTSRKQTFQFKVMDSIVLYQA